MRSITANYPATDEHNQLPIQAIDRSTIISTVIVILNVIFWVLIPIKNSHFETLPYSVLHLISLYENLLTLPVCIVSFILTFVMAKAALDPMKSRIYRFILVMGTLVFIFINLYGFILYTFAASKNFTVVGNILAPETSYHLALMDNASCNNPPCEVDYWYRLYQCDTAGISCKVAFESDEFWRWIGDPNNAARLQSDAVNNKLEVVVDDKVIFSGIISP